VIAVLQRRDHATTAQRDGVQTLQHTAHVDARHDVVIRRERRQRCARPLRREQTVLPGPPGKFDVVDAGHDSPAADGNSVAAAVVMP